LSPSSIERSRKRRADSQEISGDDLFNETSSAEEQATASSTFTRRGTALFKLEHVAGAWLADILASAIG